jgi:antitoxin component YwqK of YwqJK toxin-antitoxin module
MLLLPLGTFAQIGMRHAIPFKFDTLFIEANDTVVYRKGDEMTGAVKYRAGGFSYLVSAEDGHITGKITCFADGRLKHETSYKEGKLHGTDREWNRNGLVVYNGHYNNGYADSIWTWFYNDGIKETEGAFLYDSAHLVPGFEIVFRYEEKMDSAYTLTSVFDRQSPPHGDWNFYNLIGQKVKTLRFDKGVLKSVEVGSDHYSEDYYHTLMKRNIALRKENERLKNKQKRSR